MGPNYVLEDSAPALGAISQYHAVTLAATGVDVAGVAGARVIGIAQEETSADDATRGRIANVRVLGSSYAVAGGACTLMAPLATKNDGRLIDATTGDVPVGLCLRAATTDGDPTIVLLTPGLAALA